MLIPPYTLLMNVAAFYDYFSFIFFHVGSANRSCLCTNKTWGKRKDFSVQVVCKCVRMFAAGKIINTMQIEVHEKICMLILRVCKRHNEWEILLRSIFLSEALKSLECYNDLFISEDSKKLEELEKPNLNWKISVFWKQFLFV